MREILFRGKRTDTGEWVEGNLFIPDLPKSPTQICIGTNIVRITYDVMPESIGEFTGLTDKNGKRIFEGDIIKQTYCLNGSERDIKSVIEYGIEYSYSNMCGVCQRFSDGSGRSLLSIGDKNGTVFCEIIGNIHDNPELLTTERSE